jgi:hypothetical protein
MHSALLGAPGWTPPAHTLVQLSAAALCSQHQPCSPVHTHPCRESPSGLSTLGYFFGHLLADTLDLALRPLIFYTVFYSVAFPSGDWASLFCIFLAVTWYCYGLGYLVSLTFSPSAAVVAATAVGLVLGGIFNGAQPALAQLPDGDPMKIIDQFSFTRWGPAD